MSNSEFVPDPTQPKWKQKIAERLWKDSQTKAYAKPEQAVATEDYSQFMDSVPDVSSNAAEDEKRLETVGRQQFIDRISIIDVYKKLTGNQVKASAGQTNSIMGFCVSPSHNNVNSEAMQMSTDNTWVCHACEQGASQVGMVAFSQGVSEVGAGKLRGQTYAKAEEQLLEMFGWQKVKSFNGHINLIPPSEPEEVKPKKDLPKQEQEERPLASVTSIADEEIQTEEPKTLADRQHGISLFDWRSNLPKGSFLWEYMDAASNDDCVELFHLGYGLCLLGSAIGKQVELEDQYSVYANTYFLMYGDTGGGKSKASIAMRHVMGKVLEFDKDEDPQQGVRWVESPSSGPGIVTPFRRAFKTKAKKGEAQEVEIRGSVKAIIEYGELEELAQRMVRDQTGLRPTIQKLFHTPSRIGTIAKVDGESGYYADEPYGSIISTTQPDNTANVISQSDVKSGLINRFIVCVGEYKPSITRGKPILHLFDDKAVPLLQEIKDWAYDTRRVMEWDNEAGKTWDEFQRGVLEPDQVKYDPNIFNRNVTNMKKILLLSAANNMHERIEMIDVQLAMAMWPWMRDCYNLLSGRINMTEKTELEERIIHYLKLWDKKNPGKDMPQGQLKERLSNNGKSCSRDDMLKALETLQRSGDIVHVPPGKDRHGKEVKSAGRPTDKWYAS